jgi:hypothetical protein
MFSISISFLTTDIPHPTEESNRIDSIDCNTDQYQHLYQHQQQPTTGNNNKNNINNDKSNPQVTPVFNPSCSAVVKRNKTRYVPPVTACIEKGWENIINNISPLAGSGCSHES